MLAFANSQRSDLDILVDMFLLEKWFSHFFLLFNKFVCHVIQLITSL